MPTYADPLLPNADGLALGSPSQKWTIYGANIFGTFINQTQIGASLTILNSTASMVFSGFTAYEVTLIGDVTSSTFSGIVGYYTFIIIQDGTGGHAFTWPSSFVNEAAPSPTAGGSLIQTFFWDGVSGYAIAPGMVFP